MIRLVDRFPGLKRAILADYPFTAALAWSVAAILLPLGLRLSIDNGEAGVPFTTFYPTVMLTALLLGWRWGAAVMMGSAIVANRVLMPRPLDVLDPVQFQLAGLFLLSCAVLVATAELARTVMRQLEAAKEREELLKRELLHRVKNMHATVAAIASMTAHHSPPDQYRTALTGRLDALGRATALLGTEGSSARDLREVIESAVTPFRTPDNIVIHGPACSLPGRICVPLSLALHELCTNAVKYGALSVLEGKVEIDWKCDATGELLAIEWSEHLGPPVLPPMRKGLGTQLLQRQQELGEVEIIYAPAGLKCNMAIRGNFLAPASG